MTASSGSSPKPGPRPSGDDAAAQAKDAAGQAKDAAKDAIEKATDSAKDAAAQAKDAVARAADTAKDKAKDAGDKAKDAAGDAKDKAKDAADSAKDAAQDAGDKAKEAAGSAKHRIADATGNARDTAREKIEEHRRGDAPRTDAPRGDVPLTKPLRAADVKAARSPVSVTAPAAVADPDDEPSIGQLVSTATEAMSTLVRSEIELAKLELRSTVKNGLTGAGMFVGALVVLVFSLTFGFITLAEGIIALGLDRWLGYLIVFGVLLLLVGVLVVLGIKKVKKVKAPEKTIRTTKETVGYLKSHKPSQG